MLCSTFAEVGSKEQIRLRVDYAGLCEPSMSHYPVVVPSGESLETVAVVSLKENTPLRYFR